MYTIKQVSEITGMSVHTIRYYDDNNLIEGIVRTASNQRLFTDEAIEWLYICKTLRQAGLSIKEIAQYRYLYSQGNNTLQQRKQMIQSRYDKAEKDLEILNIRMKVLKQKLQHYDSLLRGQPETWSHQFIMDCIDKERNK